MQSYISTNLESSEKRKAKGSSSGTHQRTPRERFKYWLRKVITVLFSQVGVGSILVCYTILGAMLFISIESPVDSRRLSQVATLRSTTVIQLWNVTQSYNVIYGNEWSSEVDQIVRRFQTGLVREIRLGYQGIDAKRPWTFPQALMFSLSVYTTIGYGNLTPKTDWGKATTCLYALVGIPLLLLYMANVGDLLATSFRQFYRTLNRCETQVNKMRELSRERRRRRRMSLEGENEQEANLIVGRRNAITAAEFCESVVVAAAARSGGDYAETGQSRGTRQDGEGIGGGRRSSGRRRDSPADFNESGVDNNEYGANEVTIPISTCLSVFACYILLGSILFSWWEGWEYFEGSYFCFVSLVTIGFSDMVPGQRRIVSRALLHTSVATTVAQDNDDQTKSSVSINTDAFGGGAAGDAHGATPSGSTSAAGSNGREESLDQVDGQLILCSIYILFGMALMAMCFHLTQERFFTTAKKLGRTLHLI